MIAKIEKGRGFRGALNYALEKEGALLIGGNMASSTPRGMAAEFRAFREMRPKLKKAVAHVSLSVEKDAVLKDEQWAAIGEKYMQGMGYGDSAYTLVRHSDAEHDHVHIIASRIRPDGTVVSDSNDYQRQEKLMREIEAEYGLQKVENSWESGRKAMSSAEVRRYKEAGQESERFQLQTIIDGILATEPKSFADYADACEIAGISLVPQLQNKGKKLNGLVYSMGDIHFKASSLGKKYAPNGLNKNGVSYGTERDYEAGRRLADRAKDAAAAQRSGSLGGSEPDQPSISVRPGSGDPINQRGIQGAGGSGGVDRGSARRNQHAIPDANRRGGGDIGHGYDVHINALAVAASGPRHKSKALQAKEQQWQQQHEALQALRYRITLKGRKEGLKDWNLGKNKDAPETLWSHEQVTEKLGFLSKKNAEGYDIYLTPMDTGKHFFLVDDMTPESEKALLDNGYTPALVQESSAGNRQAILICVRDESDKDEQKHANKVLSGINKKYGDPKLSGVIRPFRMAGFANKKEGKGSPFTKIVSAVNRLCDKTYSLLQQVKEIAKREREAAAQAKAESMMQRELAASAQQREQFAFDRSTLDDEGQKFDQLRQRALDSARKNGQPLDESRADFVAARWMIQAGYSAADVEIAIMQNPATARKNNAVDYAQRTVAAAENAVNTSPVANVERSEYVKDKRDNLEL